MKWRFSYIGLIFLVLSGLVVAVGAVDPPEIEWAKCYGGSSNDYATQVIPATGGGFIFTGHYSPSGGQENLWLVKVTGAGVAEWSKSYGGSGSDYGQGIIQTQDGGYLLIGTTSSTDGDVSGNHGNSDLWLIKTNTAGSISWKKCFGGASYDSGYSCVEIPGEGYLLVGSTSSSNGDVQGNHGGSDIWVIKVDTSGTIIWQHYYGGTGDDYGSKVYRTGSGEYLISGYVSSNNGDISGNHGNFDIWLAKLSESGTIIWQKCYGGSSADYGGDIVPTSDGGFLITGDTESSNGQVSGNHGQMDAWIFKIDAAGSLTWQRCIGGSQIDWGGGSIQLQDGSYVVSGVAASSDGDISENHGSDDIFLAGLTTGGTLDWLSTYGGSSQDWPCGILLNSEGSLIITGLTSSNDGDISGNHGNEDGYLIKLDLGGAVSPPVAAFAADVTSGTAHLIVTFTDQSTGSPTSWSWTFGDGGTSTQQNPVYTYTSAGTYTVSLTVSNTGGSDTETKTSYISVSTSTVTADFTANMQSGLAPLTVQFTDLSTGSPTSWSWDFGDGGSSTQQNPTHTYTTTGDYAVSLTASKTGNLDTEVKTAYISVHSSQCDPQIVWQKCLGGTDYDDALSIKQTADGGYILAGGTQSNNGDVSGNPSYLDLWIVKLDSTGSIIWQQCLGGTGLDCARFVQQTMDGAYIVAGNTRSTDGDVTGNHGGSDFWVLKLSTTGIIEWQKCLGGMYDDTAYSVQQTDDGGFIVAGETVSNDGDVSGWHGFMDAWIVKLDSTGNITWQKCLGGTSGDYLYSIQKTLDGGYIVAGETTSNDGDVSGNHGGHDFWVVKLDSNGTILWQKCLGGTGWDIASSIQQTSDEGYIVTGSTNSNDGDVSGNHGSWNFWVVKLDSNGTILWQKCLGGTGWDHAYSIQQTIDSGFIVAGYTESNDGDVSGNHGGHDFWVVKLNSTGNTIWQKCLGGTSSDEANSVQQTADGGYIVAGSTYSNDGDVSGNHGGVDFWIVKLADCTTSPQLTPFPSCTNLPTDPDGDGVYEDTNGNGRKDFNDIVIFFKQMTWVSLNEPIECFDFNGNSRIDFNDVVMMFQEM